MGKSSIKDLTVMVDWEKLVEELKKREVSLIDASVLCGHSTNYFACMKHANLPIRKAYLRLLEVEYHIKPETLILTQEEPINEEQEVKAQSVFPEWFTEETLYKIINEATYNAVKRALGE